MEHPNINLHCQQNLITRIICSYIEFDEMNHQKVNKNKQTNQKHLLPNENFVKHFICAPLEVK